VSEIYPFKRKEQVGDQRWYEKIRMSYTGTFSNSINNVKEYDFFNKNLIKDWKNGMQHSIPISASFNVLKYITVSSSINYTERWYTSQVDRNYDYELHRVVPVDTTYGFYRVYNYSASVNANTKLYGMYTPWALFGKWTKGVQIRHVLTPTVSFNGAPDFSDPLYGMYRTIQYYDEMTNKFKDEIYSPFEGQLYGVPSRGKSGSLNFSLDNNLEMKVPIAGTDSTRKYSLIDNLSLRTGYNFLADSMNWDNVSASIRLKLFGKSTLSLQGQFDTYLYNEQGNHINKTRFGSGKGFGRFMGTTSGYSYSLNNETIKKLLNLFSKEEETPGSIPKVDESFSEDEITEDYEEENNQQTTLRKPKKTDGEYDSNGYLVMSIPWNLSFNYSISLSYDRAHFDKIKREYPYMFSQTLGFSGNIAPAKGWNFSFNTSYDFDQKKFAYTQCTLSRQMHCWTMSASFSPIGPMQYYSFTIAVNSSMLQDLKYSQSSNYRDAVNWGE
jgi:hypothetical protein